MDAISNVSSAANIAYDNTGSGLTATNVQAAIDEIAGGGSGYTVVHTAAANQTYTAQLTELETAYNALSANDRFRCKLIRGTAEYHCMNNSGTFVLTYCNASGFSMATMDFATHKYLQGAISENTPPTDYGSSNDTMALSLVMF